MLGIKMKIGEKSFYLGGEILVKDLCRDGLNMLFYAVKYITLFCLHCFLKEG